MKRVAAVLALFVVPIVVGPGCSQQAVTVPVRSLERSERSASLCLGNPYLETPPGLPLEACTSFSTSLADDDFSVPHAISLVTQTRRGEVAVVDVTAGGVVDVDGTRPGFNFLPTGAVPTDIVATPGSTAAFVSNGDPLRPGIFGISSFFLFPRSKNVPQGVVTGHPVPTLGSFPACSLPSIPSQMVVTSDRTSGRAHCDGHADIATPNIGFDLTNETTAFGRQKLLVLMPDVAQIAVIDAQELLARPAGSFDACPIEGTITLSGATDGSATTGDGGSDAIAPLGDDAGDTGSSVADASLVTDGGSASSDGGATVCSLRPGPTAPRSTTSHPAEMALSDDGRLFVSDDEASVIHYLDTSDVCALVARPPLLPVSALDPSRAVVSGAIAVSPLTSDNKRFVYAVDIKDRGSVMVFDVSSDSTVRTPILRPDVVENPNEPADRIAFNSPVQSLAFARHDRPLGTPDPVTGLLPRGVATACDPNLVRGSTSPLVPYLPPTDFVSAGAGPATLRGVFGFLVLATGQMAVIDVEDFDAACRRPQGTDDKRLGCSGSDVTANSFPSASQEVSCRVVERNRARSQGYVTNVSPLANAPAMQAFPVLHLADATVISVDPSNNNIEAATRPKLLGPLLSTSPPPTPGMPTPTDIANSLLASVSGGTTTPGDFSTNPVTATSNWVAFDLVEPRAHQTQTWNVTYEGKVSTFDGRVGRLQCAADKPAAECETSATASNFDFYDSSAAFCDRGVAGASLATPAVPTGDVVQVLSDFPDPADPYWASVSESCTRSICEQVFGTVDNLAPSRDLTIEKSYQDHLSLRTSSVSRFTRSGPNGVPIQVDLRPLACCFPYPVSYVVRGSQQWIVAGSSSGFQHDLTTDSAVADASTAACVHSCDPNVVLRRGRIANRPVGAPVPQYLTEDPPSAAVSEDQRGNFRNPQLRMVMWGPASTTCTENPMPDAQPKTPCLVRDMYFSFSEGGGFSPLLLPLSATAAVLPQSIRFVPGLEQLAIPDAASQGLILFDLSTVSVRQSIF